MHAHAHTHIHEHIQLYHPVLTHIYKLGHHSLVSIRFSEDLKCVKAWYIALAMLLNYAINTVLKIARRSLRLYCYLTILLRFIIAS